MTPLPVVHQLRARSGRGSTEAANVFALTNVPPRPPLYLFVDALDADDAVCAQIVTACTTAYKSSSASLTGALLAVVRAASRVAQSSSANALCGMSALVVNGGDAILAQVEPTACWLLREGKLLRYPQESVWLDANSDDKSLQLMDGGLRVQSEPELTRITLQPNDRLLLGTTSIARNVGELLIAQAIARDDATTALHDLVPDLEFAALSIVPITANMTTSRKREAASRRKQPSANLQSTSSASNRPAPRADEVTPREPSADDRALASRPAKDRHSALPDLRPYLQVIVISAGFIVKAFWTFISGLLHLLSRALPARERAPLGRVPQAHRPVMQSSGGEGRVLFSLAVAIPILVLIFAAIFYNQAASKPRVSDKPAYTGLSASDLITQATTIYQSALTLPSDQKKSELLKASHMIDEALLLAPQDAKAKELQNKVEGELDKLSNVTKFFFYPLLYDFGKDAGSHPSTVIARGGEVYVLDTGLNRLYKFTLNEAKDGVQSNVNPVVLRQGDERGNIVIGQLADIFWATAGNGRAGSGVLTLTAAKQLAEYTTAKSVTVLKLADAPTWQEATRAESFNGNLYVLDAKANRILKFAPTGEDYKSAPTDYVASSEKVDFAGATDFSIDGFVYVLLADGTLMKFDSGHLLPFDKKGLDLPLKKPVALIASPNSQSIWVADAGNKRIVQFNKSGDYVKQLKPDDVSVMGDLRGLAVDEASKRFYFVNGNKLYMGTLQN